MTSDILIRGNLNLITGRLVPSSYNLELQGDVTGSSGILIPGTGSLVFNGSGRQNLNYNVSCGIMELAKPADTLFINTGRTLFCEQYMYTEGVMNVTSFAEFYALDLYDDCIKGSFILKEYGYIELYQDISQSIDLNGVIKIEGGDFIIYGGSGVSNWPGNTNSELWISDGVLDFKDHGIHLSNAATFIEVITGGVIRTTGSFTSDRNDFTPVGGYIELYGTADADLAHGIGGAFWEVRIDKGSGTVNAIQNLGFDNTLLINSGSLDVNAKVIDIANDLDIFGSLQMTTPACTVNVGSNVIWEAGSSSNIDNGLITFKRNWYFNEGTNALLSGNNVAKATSSAFNQYIYHEDADASFANFSSEKPFVTTQRHLYLDNSSPYPMQVSGDFTLGNAGSIRVDSAVLIVGGNILTNASSFMRLYNTGSISANTATVNGIVNLFGGSITAGTATVNGGMVMTDNGEVILTDLNLDGTLNINSGSVRVHNSFNQATGGHLTLNGGSFIIDKPYTGNMFGFSGITDLNGGFFEISYEGIQFGTGATVNFNGGDMRIGGHFRAVNANSFQPDSGTVELINTIGTNIEVNNGNYFHHLLINKNTGANPCLLIYPAIIQGDLSLQSGELGTMNNALNIGGDLLISPNGRLSPGSGEVYVGGDWTNNRGTTGFIEATSSVWFTSSQPATVSSETFYKLDIDKNLASGQYLSMTSGAVINVLDKFTLNDGVLLMSNNSIITINGDLHIKNGAGLNANSAATGTTINCYGHFWDYNTVTDADHGFSCGQSTVNFKGLNEQELIALAGATFYKLNLQKPSDALVTYNNVTVLNDLNLQTGEWTYGITGLTHVFKKDFNYQAGASWSDHKNTVSFEGDDQQFINNTNGNTLEFGEIQVDQENGAWSMLNIGSDIICSVADFISGFISVSDRDFDCWEHFSVLEDAYVQIGSGSRLRIGDGGDIDVNGGILFIGGEPENQSLVSHITYGYFDFLVHNQGELRSLHTVYEYMGTRGIEIDEDGYLDYLWPLLGCTFRNGASSGSLLLINNSQDVYLHDVYFPENTWSGSYNVSKNVNFGNVYLPDADGSFAGPFFEYDPNSRIHWPSTGIWDGDVSTEWHNAQNWRYDFQSPDAATDVIIPSGRPNYPIFSARETTVNSLKMEPNTSLTISKDSLYVSTYTDIQGILNMPADYTALFTDSLIWQAGSSASLANRATIYISGSMFIRKSSNLDMESGEIKYYGDGESRLICHDTAQIFSLLNYKNAPYGLSLTGDTLALLNVNGTFRNGPGATLKCPSSQDWAFNGNFRNTDNGHFRCENGSIRLTGSINSTYFRPNYGDFFHDLIIETTTPVYLNSSYTDTLRIYGDLIFNSGPGIVANAFRILTPGSWINNSGVGAFSAGSSRVIFSGTGLTQMITGNTTFYDVEAGAGNTGSLSVYGNNSVSNLLLISYPVYVNGDLNASVVNIDDSGPEIHLMNEGFMQIGTLIQGGLVQCHGGTLNVTDLNENFVIGNYIIDDGLVILNQAEDYSTHDLYGNITINGGELRFTGGSSSSLWPGTLGGGAVNLNMSGGLFNLQNHWVEITSNAFSENISAGTIRLRDSFLVDNGVSSFNPSGGTVELVPENDSGIRLPGPDCWFWDLHINNGNDGGMTYPLSNIKVKHELRVISGTFNMDGYEINVGP